VAQALDDAGAIDRWLGGLRARSWWRRADAAEKLGRAGVARAIPPLTQAMEDEVPEVRLRAAQALGLLGTGPALRPLVDALCEPNRWSAIRVAEILTARGEEVVDEIEHAFDGLTPRGKLAALDVVANLRARRAVPWLERRLDDSDADVRARAAHALGAIGDPTSGPALVRALADDAWPPRAMAARALGRVGHEPAIEPLARALRDREWWVRRNAAHALRAMGPAGLDALRGMLGDEDTYARHQAILMLEEARVVDEDVVHLIDTGERRERATALVRALVRAGQLGRLQVLREQHPDPRVRAALAGLVPADGPGEAGR
jgi:HEAT repeat protein